MNKVVTTTLVLAAGIHLLLSFNNLYRRATARLPARDLRSTMHEPLPHGPRDRDSKGSYIRHWQNQTTSADKDRSGKRLSAKSLRGPITVNGVLYDGEMTEASSLTDQETADRH